MPRALNCRQVQTLLEGLYTVWIFTNAQ